MTAIALVVMSVVASGLALVLRRERRLYKALAKELDMEEIGRAYDVLSQGIRVIPLGRGPDLGSLDLPENLPDECPGCGKAHWPFGTDDKEEGGSTPPWVN